MYGALLNPGCRFFDKRIGQSTTLTGRTIAKHMDAYANECITGVYDHVGDSIIYGDSVAGYSMIRTEEGEVTIEEIFEAVGSISVQDDKQYAIPKDEHIDRDGRFKVLGYNAYEDTIGYHTISYIMRHATSKHMFEVFSDNGTAVVVTADHSLIVDRDGFTINVVPSALKDGDLLITITDGEVGRSEISRVVDLGLTFNYVYDISIKEQDPFFFANDILVHNTDSVMFSAWPFVKDAVARGEMEWNADIAIALYDSIADKVNESFPSFMKQACNCPPDLGALIKGGREIVASQGLFIKKKRYAMNVIDKDNKRQDVDGKPGKLKAMGLDLKRSDTPKVVQDFLARILVDVLTGEGEDDILPKITKFRREFANLPAWEKGTPKRVNKLTFYGQELNKAKLGYKAKKPTIPGHVRAALNWNTLKNMHGDNYSGSIVDGQKVIVCKLKENPLKMTSVAYPIDQSKLPDWFKELPFDNGTMEETIIDQKVENLLGVLNWDLASTAGVQNAFALMFGKAL